ncbi:unnamed protein product, partial [Gulo gulo]
DEDPGTYFDLPCNEWVLVLGGLRASLWSNQNQNSREPSSSHATASVTFLRCKLLLCLPLPPPPSASFDFWPTLRYKVTASSLGKIIPSGQKQCGNF